jgi:O-antigen ligase
MPGYPQYILDDRATGSYYCPDHFAGIMELAFAVGLAVVLTRETRGHSKFLAVVLMAAAVWAILLSKSRGGGLTLLAMLAAAVVWSFSQWRPRVQWALRSAAVGLAVIAALALVLAGTSYVERFRKYPWRQIEAMDRYQMIAAALRAWKTAPVFGIGPGMHQNLWPHFAATPDGDPAAGKWPTYPNTTFHSYEVHSDWTQLLEEYGAVGLALFLAAIGVTLSVLLRGRARALRRMRRDGQETGYYWAIQAALLASAGLAFHSLGDFNLQMPATTWLLAALVSVPLAHIVREV